MIITLVLNIFFICFRTMRHKSKLLTFSAIKVSWSFPVWLYAPCTGFEPNQTSGIQHNRFIWRRVFQSISRTAQVFQLISTIFMNSEWPNLISHSFVLSELDQSNQIVNVSCLKAKLFERLHKRFFLNNIISFAVAEKWCLGRALQCNDWGVESSIQPKRCNFICYWKYYL